MTRPILTLTLAAAAFAAGPALGQESYPDRAVTLVVPYAAGGGTDVLARMIQPALSEELGVPVIIENASGGGTLVGTERVTRADPDGYELLFTTSVVTLNTLAYRNPLYSMDDFVPVAPVSQQPYFLIMNQEMPFDDVPGFVAYAQAHPGEINYVSLGQASPTELLAGRLQLALGIELTRVPYAGSGAAIPDLSANRVQMQMTGASRNSASIPNMNILAVAGDERIPLTPEVPTFLELGYPTMVGGTWFGVFAPAGTPEDRVQRLTEAFAAVRARMDDALNEAGHYAVRTPDGFPAFIAADMALWNEDIQRMGIALD
jgi:Uncharacterized protein conserved in bacteria